MENLWLQLVFFFVFLFRDGRQLVVECYRQDQLAVTKSRLLRVSKRETSSSQNAAQVTGSTGCPPACPSIFRHSLFSLLSRISAFSFSPNLFLLPLPSPLLSSSSSPLSMSCPFSHPNFPLFSAFTHFSITFLSSLSFLT